MGKGQRFDGVTTRKSLFNQIDLFIFSCVMIPTNHNTNTINTFPHGS